jgi:acetolactate synthase I/II/III large subunit
MSDGKYSDQFMDWLVEDGYTHCFFVGGGNVMHLLESARTRFTCVAVVHEVTAGIAAEYFNEASKGKARAFALVTAGPGLTNIVTAIGGAWLEGRELLVIGGQAKVSDLSHGRVRQIGHQEIDGVGIVKPITVMSLSATRRLDKYEVLQATRRSRSHRKGPVFIEMSLDVSAMPQIEISTRELPINARPPQIDSLDLAEVISLWKEAKRPMILIGGGVDRDISKNAIESLMEYGVPIATTWNGFDRVSFEYEYYAGRPNTYGMRWSNIAIQSADLVIAIGTRLGIQQVGFSSHLFAPLAKLVQVDLDRNELEKGFPSIDLPVCSDANQFLALLAKEIGEFEHIAISEWQGFIKHLREELHGPDKANIAKSDYLELHSYLNELSKKLKNNDLIACCSSGGTFNAVMQVFENKNGQIVISDKGSASMGYGLAGAIGMAFSAPGQRIIHFEGDGGFAQNMQDIGTVAINNLNVKMFISSNKGYASIRTTQKSYFEGNYLGCDGETGLGLPNWETVFAAYGIPVVLINERNKSDERIFDLLNMDGPAAFILDLDPEQMYYPKLTSRLIADGRMETNPLHLMYPNLSHDEEEDFMRYLPQNLRT